MSDICDKGSECEFQYIDNLLKYHAAKHRRPVIGMQTLYCEDCGELIPDKRLQAVPGTTRCVKCQEEYERGTNA